MLDFKLGETVLPHGLNKETVLVLNCVDLVEIRRRCQTALVYNLLYAQYQIIERVEINDLADIDQR